MSATSPMPALLFIPPGEVPHLIQALKLHRQWCREQGYAWSPWRDELEHTLFSVLNRQEPSPLDTAGAVPDGAPMNGTGKLAYDLDEAARLLSVSKSTVERLVAGPDPELPSIRIGKARRIHRHDLEDYLAGKRKAVA